jgi:lysophospholipase L1-like esterase
VGKKSWLIGSIVVLGALVLGAGTVWADKRNYIVPPSAQSLFTDSAGAAAISTEPTPQGPTFAVLGDSLAEGDGAEWQEGWVPQVAERMCWSLMPVSQPGGAGVQPGTGYTNPGSRQGGLVYLDRVAPVLAEHPRFVLVEGGTNDRSSTPQNLTDSATAVLNAVKQRIGDGTVIAIGPVMPPGPGGPTQEATRVSQAIAAAAQKAEVPFIDPVAEKWLNAPALWRDDGHPNKDGYAEYAFRLVDKFAQGGILPSCK